MPLLRLIMIGVCLVALAGRAAVPAEYRTNLVAAILSEDLGQQSTFLQSLVAANDALVEQVLVAWRGGGVFLHETNAVRVPFFLEAQTDAAEYMLAIAMAQASRHDENWLEGLATVADEIRAQKPSAFDICCG